MEIEIQRMTKEHLEQIKDILQNQFDEFWNANVLTKELENPLSDYIVALENGEVVGYAGLWQPIDEGHITNIVTKKNKRGNHIGTKMLEEIIELARNKNLKSVTLEVNEHNEIAIKLYKKHNFVEVGKRTRYYNNTDDAIIMTLELTCLGTGQKQVNLD